MLERQPNPWYAGAYAFGRHRWRKQPDGRIRRERVPREQWHALLRDAHPGYLSWEEHEDIEHRLQAGAKALGVERRHGPPREGPALLQGRVVCGLCGSRMQIRYRCRRGGQLIPDYVCPGRGRVYAEPLCQSILGTEIDAAVGQLLVDAVTPIACGTDRSSGRSTTPTASGIATCRWIRRTASLEADWNGRLRALAEPQEEYQRQRTADRVTVDAEHRERILALAADFPAIWRDPNTPQRERKRMLSLLIEDVTLLKQRQVTAQVRFRGGATTTLTVPPAPDRLGASRHQRRNAPAHERPLGRVH